ncbi:MAG: hypothetical protein ACOC6P_03805 [Candidatus Aminicenantaceae bacterium]
MFDYIFAFFHLLLLIGAVVYAFYNLFQGNIPRFVFIIVCLIVYYFIVLHKNVKKEIQSKRKQK